VLVVLGHGRVAVDRLGQLARDLAHPVGAKVERDHRVAGADRGVAVADRGGGDELVGLAALVRGVGGLRRGVGVVLALPFE
jgi:hypothetical protein